MKKDEESRAEEQVIKENQQTETRIEQLESIENGNKVIICGYIAGIRLLGKKKAFIVIREGIDTVQTVVDAKIIGEEEMRRIREVLPESYVCVKGTVTTTPSPVESCTVKQIEIKAEEVKILSFAKELPFQIKDASWSAAEREIDPSLPTVALSKRLDCRWLDLRTIETRSIFCVYSRAMQAFRRYLEAHKYIEIKTPKVLGGCSDGGADVFSIDYFGTNAVLAQSPQLYKQMAVIGGMQRVYEIGPCFRAENSNTSRHLTEFIGVDLERELGTTPYIELVKEIYLMIKQVVEELQRECSKEIEEIKKRQQIMQPLLQIPVNPVILTFAECIDILKQVGRDADLNRDIGTEDERALGAEIKRRYSTDLFAITEYPESARPFYTSMHLEKPGATQSFDLILRGEEIASGAERVHQKKVLIEQVKAKGVSVESIQSYINAFSCGVPRHGGCGIGLERVVKLVAGVGDVHKCSMFPRDPSRLHP